jgi:hypothetical protein
LLELGQSRKANYVLHCYFNFAQFEGGAGARSLTLSIFVVLYLNFNIRDITCTSETDLHSFIEIIIGT